MILITTVEGNNLLVMYLYNIMECLIVIIDIIGLLQKYHVYKVISMGDFVSRLAHPQ